jgi:hypothetical protein
VAGFAEREALSDLKQASIKREVDVPAHGIYLGSLLETTPRLRGSLA